MTRPELSPELERLGDALRASAAADLSRARTDLDHVPAAAGRARRRPRLLAGGSLGLAGIGAALTLALSGAASSPAFAVTRLHDGSVWVKINRVSGVAGANRKLAAMGIHTRVSARADGNRLLVACVSPVEPDPYGTPKVYTPRPGQKRLHATLLPRGQAAGNTGGNTGVVPSGNTGGTSGNTGGTSGNTSGNTGGITPTSTAAGAGNSGTATTAVSCSAGQPGGSNSNSPSSPGSSGNSGSQASSGNS